MDLDFATLCVHGGGEPDKKTGAVTPPIFQASTYVQENVGELREYFYSRAGNPTRKALEDALAQLEQGYAAMTFASGMAAVNALTQLLEDGSHILVTADVYGGSYMLFNDVLSSRDLHFEFIDMRDPATVAASIRDDTKMIWIESPTNPLLHLIDIAAVADIVKGKGILNVVDNTFASPICQNPLELGADLVLHSTTKYIGGHSDLIGGAVITANTDLAERLQQIQFVAGAVNSPFECFLLLRSIRTLYVRMLKHQENAMQVATALENSNLFYDVAYPGLPSHPQHELAQRQMRSYSGMVSVRLRGDFRSFLPKLKLFGFAASLGGVESLINHPDTITHSHVPPEYKQKLNITPDLVRLSIGIEDPQDLISDLFQAAQRS